MSLDSRIISKILKHESKRNTYKIALVRAINEVIDALMVAYGINKEEVLRKQAERREERGGFEGRVKLVKAG